MNETTKQFLIRVVIPIILGLFIFLSLPQIVSSHEHGHTHDHGHGHEEPPSFKWSQEANTPYQDDVQEDVNHGHVHEEVHHGHVHEEVHHGHVHDEQRIPAPGHAHGNHERVKKTPIKVANTKEGSNVWMQAIGATILISVAPYLILFFIPVTNAKEHQPYLKILLAFASGSLLGDAFLHLIPHALMAQTAGTDGSHSHSHSHSHSPSPTGEEGIGHGHDMTVGKLVLAGIIVFLVVEKIVRILKSGHTHSHSHSHGPEIKDKSGSKKASVVDDSKNKEDKITSDDNKDRTIDDESDIKVAAYLNLAADFTHNLTDGLAIGASFVAGRSIGIVTTLTIFLHEIPHEIGDFAILLQSGYSRKRAMKLQLVTAAGALTGTVISLLAEGADDSAISWILPFTAGGFIYIATVSVIPELLENSHFWQSAAEVAALLCGVGLMMGIATLEEMGHVV